jgi:hypothetical protein
MKPPQEHDLPGFQSMRCIVMRYSCMYSVRGMSLMTGARTEICKLAAVSGCGHMSKIKRGGRS